MAERTAQRAIQRRLGDLHVANKQTQKHVKKKRKATNGSRWLASIDGRASRGVVSSPGFTEAEEPIGESVN